MARVLGRVRLSRLTDESTSEQRQRDRIMSWARERGHVIVGWAVDLDVSGSVPPFETPQFGEWLRDPGSFDIIVAWKLDRIGRGIFDLNDLFRWCYEKQKKLACTDDPVDLTSDFGIVVATLIAAIAQMELNTIRARNKASADELLRQKRWSGGTMEWGLKAVELPSGGYGYAINEDVAPIIREIFERVSKRQSVNSVANWLTDSGVVPPRGGEKWSTQSLTRILRGRWVLGQVERSGQLVMDTETGLPLQRCEGIVSLTLWQEVQAVLDDSVRRKINVNEKGMLLGVLRCGECSSPMYLHVMKKPDRVQTYRYWRCSGKAKRRTGCENRGVPAADIETYVAEQFLTHLGSVERTVQVFVPASGAGDEIAVVENAIATVRKERDLGLYEGDDDDYFARLTALVAKKKALAEIPSMPARWRPRERVRPTARRGSA